MSQSLNRKIIDTVDVGIVVIDATFTVRLWNSFMVKHSGIDAASIVGKNLLETFDYLPVQWLNMKVKSVLILKNYSFSSWKQRNFLFRFRHNRPITSHIENMYQDCTFLPIRDEDTDTDCVCITIHDVTDVAIFEKKLEDLSEINVTLERLTHFDGLTNVYNRRYIEEQLSIEFQRAQRGRRALSIIMFDLDRFKLINDNFGHLGGDEVLREVARRVERKLGDRGIIGRYGGEEFLILLPGLGLAQAATVAEELRYEVDSRTIEFEGLGLPVQISLGVGEIRPDILEYPYLIRDADRALYEAKAAGRNRVCLAPPLEIANLGLGTRSQLPGPELHQAVEPRPIGGLPATEAPVVGAGQASAEGYLSGPGASSTLLSDIFLSTSPI